VRGRVKDGSCEADDRGIGAQCGRARQWANGMGLLTIVNAVFPRSSQSIIFQLLTNAPSNQDRGFYDTLLPQNKKSSMSINFDVEVSNATQQLSCTTMGTSSCVIYSLGYREVPLKWENVQALQPPHGAPCPVLGDFGGGREELAKDKSNLGGSCISSGFKCAGFCGSPNPVGIEARTWGMPSVGCRCAH